MIITTCQEDWNQMTPDAQGRHCAVCDLTVLNLKGKTHDEIVSIKEEKGKICGRVTQLQVAEFQYLHPLKRFAIALFLVFGTGLFTTSYSQILGDSTQQAENKHEFTLKFKAIDSKGKPLPGVYISFDSFDHFSDYKEGTTDENGELSISFWHSKETIELTADISYEDIYGTLVYKASSKSINHFDRIVYDSEKYVLRVGELEFSELYLIGDVEPDHWSEDPYEQKTEHN